MNTRFFPLLKFLNIASFYLLKLCVCVNRSQSCRNLATPWTASIAFVFHLHRVTSHHVNDEMDFFRSSLLYSKAIGTNIYMQRFFLFSYCLFLWDIFLEVRFLLHDYFLS